MESLQDIESLFGCLGSRLIACWKWMRKPMGVKLKPCGKTPEMIVNLVNPEINLNSLKSLFKPRVNDSHWIEGRINLSR
jgi:hypothetical protein